MWNSHRYLQLDGGVIGTFLWPLSVDGNGAAVSLVKTLHVRTAWPLLSSKHSCHPRARGPSPCPGAACSPRQAQGRRGEPECRGPPPFEATASRSIETGLLTLAEPTSGGRRSFLGCEVPWDAHFLFFSRIFTCIWCLTAVKCRRYTRFVINFFSHLWHFINLILLNSVESFIFPFILASLWFPLLHLHVSPSSALILRTRGTLPTA